MSSTDHIRYDLLAQDALRGVVRRVLMDVAREGLPGDHHFFIAFDTRAPGVRLSARMKEKYPEEMTVILQHQFWDLDVTENSFEVGLSFGGIPERLLVPFSALKGFFDPSVKFGLQFELADAEAASEEAPAPDKPTTPILASVPAGRPAVRGAASEPTIASVGKGALKDVSKDEGAAKTDDKAGAKDGAAKDKAAKDEGDAALEERAPGGAEVVRLDVFRKK